MPSILALGQRIKVKFKGIYDDLSDFELGTKIKTKYPEYSDFKDTDEPIKPFFKLTPRVEPKKPFFELPK